MEERVFVQPKVTKEIDAIHASHTNNLLATSVVLAVFSVVGTKVVVNWRHALTLTHTLHLALPEQLILMLSRRSELDEK